MKTLNERFDEAEKIIKKQLLLETLQLKYSNEFFAEIDSKCDDFLDFADDYEPVQKFFAGEQLEIFNKALKLMKIYDDKIRFQIMRKIVKGQVVVIGF